MWQGCEDGQAVQERDDYIAVSTCCTIEYIFACVVIVPNMPCRGYDSFIECCGSEAGWHPLIFQLGGHGYFRPCGNT